MAVGSTRSEPTPTTPGGFSGAYPWCCSWFCVGCLRDLTRCMVDYKVLIGSLHWMDRLGGVVHNKVFGKYPRE